MSKPLVSLQACNATTSTLRRTASSNANSTAGTLLSVPSTPTSTDWRADTGSIADIPWITATGHSA
ncbi:hypothetical protein ACWDSF_35115 [Nocardia beijingensis]